MSKEYLEQLNSVVVDDVRALNKAEQSYGDSWKKRGGVGAYMMLARKIDRMENQVQKYDYNIFAAIQNDQRAEGILDDIRDLRRYLILVEAEIRARGINPVSRDNQPDRSGQDQPFGFDPTDDISTEGVPHAASTSN